ncbi:acyltransferase [Escherichia coli]|uniref:acyltransferase n=1 Tax=Escherichia coli TaxID=562 RepID=UPI003859E68A
MFIHKLSDVQSTSIGEGTNIWLFVVVLRKAIIGKDCNICANCFIENDVVIGNSVTIKSGVFIWDGVRVHDNVFIGPCVAFTNDKYPRSKNYDAQFYETIIGENSSIGVNSTILPGVKIGRNCMIGAGSVVTKDVPDNALVLGNPARIVKFLEAE